MPPEHPEMLTRTADYIASVQLPSGAIPWFEGGITDPWDHVESAMGLSVAGRYEAAEAAYRWLAGIQHTDGYWLAAYEGDRIADGTRAETNFVAYVATGVWHHYLATGDEGFLREMWPTVRAALDFVIGLQSRTGEIYWAFDTRLGINKDALVTGCSSIYRSLDCGIAIAQALDRPHAHWYVARQRLGSTLRHRPDRFDRTWASKQRYSMDWFYPVLAGAISGDDALARLDARWGVFVESGLGCRCVSDQPWVTIAETCELVMACLAAGDRERARSLFEPLPRYQTADGSWWTGYVFTDDVMWPDERPTWTAAAVLLAADGLQAESRTSALFTATSHHSQIEAPQRTKRAHRL
ncbi:MAG TPA: hypothetical protein VIS76_08050 [Pseudomonadales bacterium]